MSGINKVLPSDANAWSALLKKSANLVHLSTLFPFTGNQLNLVVVD